MLLLEERIEILELENKRLNEELLKIKELLNIKSKEKKEEIKNKNIENKLSIIVKSYKKSILIKNKYENKFTTKDYKEILKELGGKWFKNEKEYGWIFLGKIDNEKSLEENSKYIINFLNEKDIVVDIEYEK